MIFTSKGKKIGILLVAFIVIVSVAIIWLTAHWEQKKQFADDPIVTVATGVKEICVDCGVTISDHWVWHNVPRSQEKFLPHPQVPGGTLCTKCAKKTLGPQLTSWDPNPKKSEKGK